MNPRLYYESRNRCLRKLTEETRGSNRESFAQFSVLRQTRESRARSCIVYASSTTPVYTSIYVSISVYYVYTHAHFNSPQFRGQNGGESGVVTATSTTYPRRCPARALPCWTADEGSHIASLRLTRFRRTRPGSPEVMAVSVVRASLT